MYGFKEILKFKDWDTDLDTESTQGNSGSEMHW